MEQYIGPRQMQKNIEKVATLLRDRYIEQRRKYFPQYKCPPKSDDAMFEKAAKRVIELNASPTGWVDACVLYYMNRRIFPYPNFLVSEHTENTYKSSAQERAEEARKDMSMMCSLFDSHVRSGRPPAAVVMDETLYFNPLFRYYAARINHLDELAAKYAEQAREFLSSFPEFLPHVQSQLGEDIQCPH